MGTGPAQMRAEPPLGKNRDFVRLWTGQAASALGSSLVGIVYPILALTVTESAALAGLVGFVTLGGGILSQLPAGVLIDRLPLRRVLVITDLIRAITTSMLLVIFVAGHLSLTFLLITSAINGIAGAVANNAQSVAVRHVVPPGQLPRAFALAEGRGHAVGLIGQPAGAYLFTLAQVAPLIADAICYLVSALLSGSISRPLSDPPSKAARTKVRRDLLTGLRFVWTNPFLRSILIVAAGIQFVFTGVALALTVSMHLHGVSTAKIGTLFAIAAVGGILGAVAAPSLQAKLSPPALVLIMGWTATLCFAGLAWSGNPYVAGALLGLVFFAATPASAMLNAAQMQATPKQLQGRVMAAAGFIAGISAPLGAPAAGILIDHSGHGGTFMAFSVLTVIITVSVHLSRPIMAMERPS